MLKNYIKIAFRNLRKNPGYSLINIGGLSIGIACCLLIFQYVAFEYSFDRFNENAPDLYHLSWTRVQNEGEPSNHATTGWAVGPALAEETPEVVRSVRLHPEYFNAIISNSEQPDKTFEEEQVYYTDSDFFQMFTYPLISGDPEKVLAEPGSVVLSRSAAQKYFGSENPIGQTLSIKGWISGEFRVSGIFEDVPANSHLQFEFLLPMADLLQKSDFRDPSTGWGWNNFITYVQLRAGTDMSEVERKFTGIYMRNREEYFQQSNITASVELRPIQEIYLNAELSIPKAKTGSYRAVYFFTIVGIITLLIALVNYINLATARTLNRAREVGVRKAIGAQKKQLINQFLCESALTILASTVLGIALVELLMPIVNNMAGITLANAMWTSTSFWTVFPILFFASILLAGLYPAFILSSFKPVAVLKGKISKSAGGSGLRRGLVVFQFAASIVLLAGTGIVYSQLNYMRNMDLGLNLEQILTVPTPRILPEETDQRVAVETFIQELHRLPSVRQTATSGAVPGNEFSFGTNNFKMATADPSAEMSASGTSIDTSFVSLYDLELVAGRISDISYSVPEGEPRPILINEKAAEGLGFETPADALGKELSHGRVAGIFKDINWYSAHHAPGNILFNIGPGNSQISVKLSTENLPRTIASIEEIYRLHFPGNPFHYTFVDEQFDQQYRNDQRFARLFTVFAALTIFIACLGLFGLATFTAEQRTKEIGVRKVLGASVANIVGLMSKDFIVLVLVGFVVAVPVSWYVMSQWLQNFAYKIEIGPGIFAIAGSVALLIALATVSWQSVKAALMNPVKSLRSE